MFVQGGPREQEVLKMLFRNYAQFAVYVFDNLSGIVCHLVIMKRCSDKQRALVIKSYYKNNNCVVTVQRQFQIYLKSGLVNLKKQVQLTM